MFFIKLFFYFKNVVLLRLIRILHCVKKKRYFQNRQHFARHRTYTITTYCQYDHSSVNSINNV